MYKGERALLYNGKGVFYIAKMKAEQVEVWVCNVCGFLYEEQSEKMAFVQLPDDWKCPVCGAPKEAFLGP